MLKTYGRLAALKPNGEFYPQELATLQAYGRLAAAALDSAAALEETRSLATRAEALLALSSALAEIVSTAAHGFRHRRSSLTATRRKAAEHHGSGLRPPRAACLLPV